MIFNLLLSFCMFSYCVLTVLTFETNQKSVISVPTVDWNDIKGHSYLRLATPSGNIYHYTDDRGIVKEQVKSTDMNEFPFLTVSGPYSSEHYIYLISNETGYQVITRQNPRKGNLSHHLSLYQFTGADKKLYTATLGPFSAKVQKAHLYNNDPVDVDYLELRFSFDKQRLAFTFTEDGSDLIEMGRLLIDCTYTKFLMRANGNTWNSSQPYITFVNTDSEWYDIFFPANGTDSSPFLMRNRAQPRQKCGKEIHLIKIRGPDNKQYDLEFNWTLNAEGRHYFKLGHNFFDGDLVIINKRIETYRILDDDSLHLTGSFFIPHQPPGADVKSVDIDFKCLISCSD